MRRQSTVYALPSVRAAFLYGCIQTGLAEEWLFRGLLAGALGRRLSLWKANILQAVLFTAIHLPILFFVPDEWLLIIVMPTAFGLAAGWMRIKTDSLLWPWAIHSGTNLLLALLVLFGD